MNIRLVILISSLCVLPFFSEAEESYNFIVEDVELVCDEGGSGVNIDYLFGVKKGEPVLLRGTLISRGLLDYTLHVSDPDLVIYLNSKLPVIERSTECTDSVAVSGAGIDFIARTVKNLLLAVRVSLAFSDLEEAIQKEGIELADVDTVVFSVRLFRYEISDGEEIPNCSGSSFVSQGIEMKHGSDGWSYVRLTRSSEELKMGIR